MKDYKLFAAAYRRTPDTVPGMTFELLIPADGLPRDGVPRGSALVRAGRQMRMTAPNGDTFAELVAQACRSGRPVTERFDVVSVGWFDDSEGELRLSNAGYRQLSGWVGHSLYRNDLVTRDNRADRRAQARRLMMQGRAHEAYRLDRRLGF
jgi:hypothetical protein